MKKILFRIISIALLLFCMIAIFKFSSENAEQSSDTSSKVVEKVAEIVLPFYKKNDPDGACKALIKESTEWWNQEDIVVDDITVVIVFF